MAKKLPDELFVAWRDLPNDKPYLVAETTPSACLEDDGPLRVGRYQLIEITMVEKVLKVSGREEA